MSTARPEQTGRKKLSRKTSLFLINFRELWHYRDLFLMLLQRDFITFYKQNYFRTHLVLYKPILTSLIYVVLLSRQIVYRWITTIGILS
jgi:lipopolysaccharide transport system permease protein